MVDLWNRASGLKGLALQTVTGSKFAISHVSDRTVYVLIENTKNEFQISRGEIEQAATVEPLHDIRPGQLRNNGIVSPAGYITGILRAIAKKT